MATDGSDAIIRTLASWLAQCIAVLIILHVSGLAKLGRETATTPSPRLLLDAIALYLRRTPMRAGKAALLRYCRRTLLPAQPPFSPVVRPSACPSAQLRCFQLGGKNHADIMSEWLYLTGEWQPALTAYLRRALRPGDTFVDVGANSGFFSLLGAELVGEAGAVVAVEASPPTCARLREHMQLNPRLARRVRLLECAAAEAEGKVTLYCHRREQLYNTTVAGGGAGGVPAATDVWAIMQQQLAAQRGGAAALAASQLAQDGVWRAVTVRKRPLDALLSPAEAAGACVVKVDVEGSEWSVLQGMQALLARADNARLEVVAELTPRWLKLQGTSPQEVIDHMRAHGFGAYALLDDYAIERWAAAGAEPARPRRVRSWDELGGAEQADVIFSRQDAEYL
jgi:FkbM family methyltransferase